MKTKRGSIPLRRPVGIQDMEIYRSFILTFVALLVLLMFSLRNPYYSRVLLVMIITGRYALSAILAEFSDYPKSIPMFPYLVFLTTWFLLSSLSPTILFHGTGELVLRDLLWMIAIAASLFIKSSIEDNRYAFHCLWVAMFSLSALFPTEETLVVHMGPSLLSFRVVGSFAIYGLVHIREKISPTKITVGDVDLLALFHCGWILFSCHFLLPGMAFHIPYLAWDILEKARIRKREDHEPPLSNPTRSYQPEYSPIPTRYEEPEVDYFTNYVPITLSATNRGNGYENEEKRDD